MSNEQSIRDELVDRINDELDKWGEGSPSPYAIADAISPVIRRIQAEALREAADEIAATFTDPDRSRPRHPQAKVSTDYVNDPQWAELIVRNRADRIERGETA